MCGVAALFRRADAAVPAGALQRMTDLAAHRGPDGQGVEYLSRAPGSPWTVGLGHRRLSIIDLSEAGHQPMRRGARWISFNGEIYNFVELRAELSRLGQTFASGTDTEVLLAAFEVWGRGALERLRGMFAFVLVDLERGTALLARDRLGIKPLYIQRVGPGLVAVVSEQKQLVPVARLVASAEAIRTYLATGYEDVHHSFFVGVEPVPAGTSIELDLASTTLGAPEPYWFPERVKVTLNDPDEAGEAFRAALADSVKVHLRADVPVGCALSGGLDSSAIAAMIGACGGGLGALRTFSATFPGEDVDERAWIDRVVRHVDAEPAYVAPTPEDLVRELDDWVYTHDEPVGSISQYAGYAVARLTRAHGVPVTLNGQGGDEVLSGYWEHYFVHLARLARGGAAVELGRHGLGALLPGGNAELARQVPSIVRRYASRRAAGGAAFGVTLAATRSAAAWRVHEVRDLTLPRLLKWDDRNSMAFSIEGRYPFLDHPLIELGLSLGPRALYRRGWTKEPLRRGLAGLLPDTILRRKTKLGFETPQRRWLGHGPVADAIAGFVAADSPVWSFTDRAATRRLAAATRSGTASREGGDAVFRAFFIDRWIRRFDLEVRA